jgi:hypothetical protein
MRNGEEADDMQRSELGVELTVVGRAWGLSMAELPFLTGGFVLLHPSFHANM